MIKDTADRKLVKISDAAKELRIKTGVIRSWCRIGSVECERPGGKNGDYWVYICEGRLVFTKKD